MTISSSGIDATKPVEGSPTTESVRDNFAEIKTQFDNVAAEVHVIPFGGTFVFENDPANSDPSPTMSNADGEILCTREIRMNGTQALFGVNNPASSIAYATDVPGDTENRYTVNVAGQTRWGQGDIAQDVSMYRHSANSLQVEGEGNSLFRVRDNTNAAGYAGMSFQGTGSQRYSCGIGAPSETTFSVADKFFVYDPIAGKMRLSIDTDGTTSLVDGVAPAAGGSTAFLNLSSTSNLGVYFGSGAPTISAGKGSFYMRTDGSGTNDRMYVNTNGGTTWTAVVTVA